MDATLKVAFWNVFNLYEPGAVSVGPRTPEEFQSKLAVVADTINGLFDRSGPDLLGIAEIGTKGAFDELVERLEGQPYFPVWKQPGQRNRPGQFGLGLLARTSVFQDVEDVATCRLDSTLKRPRVLVTRCHLRSSGEPIIVAVNHWLSRISEFNEFDRMETAQWLQDQLAQETAASCFLLMGDFNAEPFELPFSEQRLRAGRTFQHALSHQTASPYFYNTAWKFLSEPDTWDVARRPDYREPRPKTSWGQGTPTLFDQLIVSGGALQDGPVTLRESTVRYECVQGVTARYSTRGVLEPARWRYDESGEHDGSSDHFPLLAEFTIEGGIET